MTVQTAEVLRVETIEDVDFRAAVGRFASGVTVITARHGDIDFGATASAFSSVSNDPPTILVCLNQLSETCSAVTMSGSFVVNVLADDQADLAVRFASKGADKFAGLVHDRSRTGEAVIHGAHVSMECEVTQSMASGTHVVFIAEVRRIEPVADTDPLAYHRGKFGAFAIPEEVPVRAASSGQMAANALWFGHHHDLW